MVVTEPSAGVSVSDWPPGPAGDSGLDFAGDRLGFLERAAAYGDFVPFRVGSTQAVFLGHPSLVNEVLASPVAQDFSKDYLSELIPPLVRRHLELRDADSWLPERRLAQPAFHHDRMVDYAAVMQEEAVLTASSWTAGTSIDVGAAMRRLTLRILCRTLFAVDLGAETDRATRMIDLLLDAIDSRLDRMAGGGSVLPTARDVSLAWTFLRLRALFARIVRSRRSSSSGPDLLSRLLSDHLDDFQVGKVVIPVFFAGHETTALALAWTLYLLAQRPDVVFRLRSEIDSVLGARAPVEADLARLPYVGAVFSETLRLYPPGWGFGRKALRATSVGGYEIPAGTVVWMSPWVMHRDSRWFADPLSFAPERWLSGLYRTLPRGSYIPFGLGPRRCLGSSFATLEGTLALVELVRRFDFLVAPSVTVVPKPSLTLRPVGLRLIVERRAGSA